MSAYVVDRDVIRLLVEAGFQGSHEPASVFWRRTEGGSERLRAVRTDPLPVRATPLPAHYAGDIDADEIGRRLWDENIRSVLYRYPDCTRETMPGPVGESFDYQHSGGLNLRLTPGRVFDAIDTLDYQSCEHPEWEASWAFAYLRTIRKRWCRVVSEQERQDRMTPEQIAEERAFYEAYTR